MKENIVRSAVDLVDPEPTADFIATLRGNLFADVAASRVESAPATAAIDTDVHEVEAEVTFGPRLIARRWQRRTQKVVIAAAACLAIIATAAIIANRPPGPRDDNVLGDVDAKEAQPLADEAVVSERDVGLVWRETELPEDATIPALSAITADQHPTCKELSAVGMWAPTTKSVSTYQYLLSGNAFMFHNVWVFDSPQDASKAMDVLATGAYQQCWFELIDQLTPHQPWLAGVSTSSAWSAPAIDEHGDRQVVFGQLAEYAFANTTLEIHFVNAYVQVGRAIAFVNPIYSAGRTKPLFNVEQAVAASTAALEKVFA